MASVTPRKNKNGDIISYSIRVFRGYDKSGKKIKPYTTTYRPERGMSVRLVKKELERRCVQFEEKCRLGYVLDNRQRFSDYAEYVIGLKSSHGTKHLTVERYREMLERINEHIGFMRLADIRPQHLNNFYDELRKSGTRKSAPAADPKRCFLSACEESGLLKKEIAEKAGISYSTFYSAARGKRVSLSTADAISAVLGERTEKLFSIIRDTRPLSEKTIKEHHTLISIILGQAEMEMLIPYNPAAKIVNRPRCCGDHKANYFEPSQLERIRDCLSGEPIKWRVIVNLLIVTGCRRGEIMGLEWSDIDIDSRKLFIRNSLLYSKQYGVYRDSAKTSSSLREMMIPEETAELIAEYKKYWDALKGSSSNWNEYIDIADGSGTFRREKADFLFVKTGKKLGYPMHPDSVTEYLRRFSKKKDLPHINPHAFRHTLASILCLNGIDMTTISKWLGHKNVSTTMNIYEHILDEGKERVTRCISSVLLGNSEK